MDVVQSSTPVVIRTGTLVIDLQARLVHVAGQAVALTRTEWRLLDVLARHPNQILSQAQLLEAVWGTGYGDAPKYVQIYIGRLRRKLEANASNPQHIRTEPGLGYRFFLTEGASSSHSAAATPTPPGLSATLTPIPLIGRERDKAMLMTLIAEPSLRLLTLTGPGGVGKTQLALSVAAAMQALHAWETTIVFLSAVTDAAQVLPAIAQAVGIPEMDAASLLPRVIAHLEPQTRLLVLDNFEQVVGASSVVAALLDACPLLRVMVTSREILHIAAEHPFQVAPLALPPRIPPTDIHAVAQFAAIALFVQRAQAASHNFALTTDNVNTVITLCTRLDGLPLAIELAAARCVVLSPRDIVERLDSRLSVLSGRRRDWDQRHLTMWATIDWSYALLSSPEQRLLRRLGLFVGSWTLAAAEQICVLAADERTPPSLLDDLESLVHKSLVQRVSAADGSARFTMLGVIATYAREQLRLIGDDAAVARQHALFYGGLVSQASQAREQGAPRDWNDRLARELDNLRAALSWCATPQGDALLGLQMAGSLWWFWATRGSSTEGSTWISAALERVEGSAPPELRATAHNGLGALAWMRNDFERADLEFTQSLQLWRTLQDATSTARALNNLALVAIRQGDFERAEALLLENLAIFRQHGTTYNVAASLSNLGWVAFERGQLQAAHAAFTESLTLRTEIEDGWGIAASLTNLGWAALHQQALAQATTHFSDGLRRWVDLGDKASAAECIEGLAGTIDVQEGADHIVRLSGVAQGLRNQVSMPAQAVSYAAYKAIVETARAMMPEDRAATLLHEGMTMLFDDAVAYALSATVATMPLSARSLGEVA